ncbi:unnamed protein product [Ixodes hexagonus]
MSLFLFILQGIVCTQLAWTSANVPTLAPRYQVSGTTTAVQDHTQPKSKYPGRSDGGTSSDPGVAPLSRVRQAGQWDDWSTRLSARRSPRPQALSSSASSPPPVTVRNRPASPATSVHSALIQQLEQPLQQPAQQRAPTPNAAPLTRELVYPQTTSLPTTVDVRPPRIVVRKRLVSKPLGPNTNLNPPQALGPAPQVIPKAGGYPRSTLYAKNSADSSHDNTGNYAMSPTLENSAPYQRPQRNIHSTFSGGSSAPRARETPVTISIPYQVPQRPSSPRMTNNNPHFGAVRPALQSSFHEHHVEQLPASRPPPLPRPPFSSPTVSAQRAPLVQGPTQRAQYQQLPLPPPSLPPHRFGPPPSFQRSPRPVTARPQEQGILQYNGGAAKGRRLTYSKRPPPADETDNFFSSAEEPHHRRPMRDSFEDIRQNIEREPYGQPTGQRKRLFMLPKPIDFGLSKMDQKGCKTTVKEVKHVPKEALGGAGTDLHSLFRRKRRAPEESKMTSIIMTKECFFPEDPGSEKENNHRVQSYAGSSNPTPYTSPVKDYLKTHDPQTRSTQNTPTYNSFYPQPRHSKRPFGPTPSETAGYDRSKFQTFNFSPEHFEGSFANVPSFDTTPRETSSKRYTERQGGMRGSATALSGRPEEDQGRSQRDERPWYRDNPRDQYHGDHSEERYQGPRYDDAPSRGRGGGYDRGSRPLASGTHSKRRGPPPPKTTSRSFAFYRRDENPKKDRFVESYSTANKKSFRSDYDSDRDGFF